MSMRRFVAYFLAVSAGSTVVFASTLMGRPAPTEATATEALSASSLEQSARLSPALRNQSRHKPAAKIAQVALVR